MLIKKRAFHTILSNRGVMALLNKDPFSIGFHRLSRFEPSYRPLGKISVINNASNGFSLRGCLEQRSEDYERRRVDERIRNPRAMAPLHPHYVCSHSDTNTHLEQGTSVSSRVINGHDGGFGFSNRALPDKLVVAVDVDEVLGSFVAALNKFIADRYSLNHSVSEYHVYEFFKIWNCSRDEADIRVHEFFKTSYFRTGIHPIPGARSALHKLSTFCNLSVVTSRQNAIKDHTIEWIEKHYPGLFQEIHFGNHFALDGISRPKSDICRSLGAQVLIDDNPRYALECAEAGIRVLLFDYENSYPWCKTGSATLHHLVTKVHNWEEVEQQLGTWIMP